MSERWQSLAQSFERHFVSPPLCVVSAPGRVNLIGEHTDYNDGFVLPCAIDYEVCVVAGPRADDQVNVLACDFGNDTDSFTLAGDIEREMEQSWRNYVRGVASVMQREGYLLRGCNLAVSGSIPVGAGLSSSAALEVATIAAFAELSGISLDQLTMALLGQTAENNFVGCACGIMDQLISTTAKQGFASKIDCRTLDISPVPIPDSLGILLINSNVRRELVESKYNDRRAECEQAAALCGKASLRDVSLEHLRDLKHPLLSNRARHVFEENQRVHALADALMEDDLRAIGRLMRQSHNSMRDLFEITTPEIDLLVDIIEDVVDGEGGARMTGGGFGGCVVALLPEQLIGAAVEAVARRYQQATGIVEVVYRTRPAGGLRVSYF